MAMTRWRRKTIRNAVKAVAAARERMLSTPAGRRTVVSRHAEVEPTPLPTKSPPSKIPMREAVYYDSHGRAYVLDKNGEKVFLPPSKR